MRRKAPLNSPDLPKWAQEAVNAAVYHKNIDADTAAERAVIRLAAALGKAMTALVAVRDMKHDGLELAVIAGQAIKEVENDG